ncbi:nucleotidyltransferase domain-containing protein [Butyrivibrio sp. VCD2006]|uniref:nucleotidyltransferase domain-containing protein n=1 Tax=Butyrivibrio sp. VCD2006 TaxID=1280664 RepID=UPI0004223486|nr:nucleotidyltransferase family protein [Butyrivibrio sp. VCD2006]
MKKNAGEKQMADITVIRKYTRELIKATFENRKPSEIPEGITLPELMEIAVRGQMPYLLYNSILKVTGECDENKAIKGTLVYSTMKTFMQVFAAKEITAAFEKNGIKHQVLKGTIMKNIYPSPEMREMSDIDLVVYDDSLDNASKVMESMGYKNHGLIKHHMIFSKGKELVVEVHWCLFDANAGKQQHVYFKDNFRANLKEGTEYTYEFGKEDFYVYMISHMAKHFFETGCGIRNLVDIYVFWGKYEAEMDMEYLKAELQKCGIYEFEKNMRRLAFIWMDDEECEPFYENLFEYMVNSGIYGKTENGVWGQLAKEAQGSDDHIKLHYYFPSLEFMKEKYPWLSKMPFLLPVAWIIRGICGVANKSSRDHRSQIENADKEEVSKMLEIYHRLDLGFRR